MSDIEGKAAREAVSECGQRASFNCARAASVLISAFQSFSMSGSSLTSDRFLISAFQLFRFSVFRTRCLRGFLPAAP
jgi:hypothetical protein